MVVGRAFLAGGVPYAVQRRAVLKALTGARREAHKVRAGAVSSCPALISNACGASDRLEVLYLRLSIPTVKTPD
jgi:hypothetical protein